MLGSVRRVLRFSGFARQLCNCKTGYFACSCRFLGNSSNKTKDWDKAVSDAEKIVGYPTSFMSLRCLLSDEIANVALQMRKLVGTKHPLLKTARGFIFDGKYNLQTRGLIVLLISKAAGPSPNMGSAGQQYSDEDMISGILQSQRSLAEITEIIHMANLIHKGTVDLKAIKPEDGDMSDMRFGNKMAILSGDLLLADACKALAELNNTKVVESISSAIADLMEAEFTQLRDTEMKYDLPANVNFSDWKVQTFLSSGSLIAKSCLSAMKLGNHSDTLQDAAFNFGENMAYAFQLQEDLKPFQDPVEYLQQLSLISAPIIKSLLEDQSARQKLTENFAKDKRQIIDIVRGGSAMQEIETHCQEFGGKAISALDVFDPSDAKTALVNIVKATVVL